MAAGTTMFGVDAVTRSESQIQERPQLSGEQREAVLEQLARILASPLFKHSKHYPAFLRFVVERALDGQDSRLKERAIGIEVFGRGRDYDTNLDPVVRTSACEVRKRLAQYYLESGPGSDTSDVRIEMHSGSYVPEFRFAEAAIIEEPPAVAAPPAPAPTRAPVVRPRRWQLIAALTATPLLLGVGALSMRGPSSALDQFWAPVWGSTDTLMLSMGETRSPSLLASGPEPTVLDVMRGDRLAFGDAVTMARLTGLLRASHKKYDIRRGIDFTLTELRKGPVVLIGAFNNEWTMRLQESLRFAFELDRTTHKTYIRDRKQPARTAWQGDQSMPYSQFTEDYAIISRFVNPLTEKMVVVVAGMAKDGTMAAGEFVTESKYMDAMARTAPEGWQRKNLQVVIRTQVVRGSPGPPTIVATYFW